MLKQSHKIILTERQLCDYELLINGALLPLKTFMNEEEYQRDLMHLIYVNDLLYHTLKKQAIKGVDIQPCQVVLIDPRNLKEIAEMEDKNREADSIYKTSSYDHPGVNYLMNHTHGHSISGPLRPISSIIHYVFNEHIYTPNETKEIFRIRKWEKIVGFQTRNPIHCAHFEMTIQAAKKHNCSIFLQPVIGPTKKGDISKYSRVKAYKEVLKKYQEKNIDVFFSLLPYAMRMAGPNEAILHAIIRKNFGCTHFIVGRDHAGPGKSTLTGQPFYSEYEAQELAISKKLKIGVEIIPFKELQYDAKNESFIEKEDTNTIETNFISGSILRKMLRSGEKVPEWYSFPEVLEILMHEVNLSKTKRYFKIEKIPSHMNEYEVFHVLQSKLMEKYWPFTEPKILLNGIDINSNIQKGVVISTIAMQNLNQIRF